MGYNNSANLAIYIESWDVNYSNNYIKLVFRRYNNTAFTGTLTGNIKVLYTKVTRNSL